MSRIHTSSVPLSRRVAALPLAAALVGAVIAAPTAAHAGDDDRVERRGSCSGSASWKIKAKPDDGRLEVEAEVDSNVAGEAWTWVLRHNGSRSAAGTSRTTGASGSFSIERRSVDAPGTDELVFRAVHGSQRCVARVAI